MRKIIAMLVLIFLCCLPLTYVFGNGIDENTVLLLHFNGADGATNFVDNSASNHSITAYGNAQIDTSQSKFGGASLLLDGDGDYATVPDSDNWDFGTGDFTIDFWARFNALSGGGFASFIDVSNSVEDLGVQVLYPHGGGPGYIQIRFGGTVYNFTQTLAINPWYHIAVTRNGNNMYLFLNGTQVGTTQDVTGKDITGLTLGVCIGAEFAGPGAYPFNGWIDEMRISKGIARWTSNFTPPTAEYDTTPNTSPLAHAGQDAEAYVNEDVTLDGRFSYDPDGQIVSWVWRSLSDPQKPIVAEGELVTIKAHGYAEELIELTVTDNRGATATDTMKITNPGIVGPQGPPGMTPAEVAAMQNQINTLQQENATLEQQNASQQLRLEQDRYLLEQLPQLQKKLEELEAQVP